jgi:hypothetical protein
MVLDRMPDAKESDVELQNHAKLSLSRHFLLGFGLLCFQEGALRPNMPTETTVMANMRFSDGMGLQSA